VPDVDVTGAAEHRVGRGHVPVDSGAGRDHLEGRSGREQAVGGDKAVSIGPAVLRNCENLPVDGLIATIIALPPRVSTAR